MALSDNDRICNACGKEISDEEIMRQDPLQIDHYYGYGSENDLTRLQMKVCMECADKLLPLLIDFCQYSKDSIVTEYRVGTFTDEDIQSIVDSIKIERENYEN